MDGTHLVENYNAVWKLVFTTRQEGEVQQAIVFCIGAIAFWQF